MYEVDGVIVEDAEDLGPYKIVRKFYLDDHDDEEIETGLTLAEAREHCNDPETSSRTATAPDLVKLTADFGFWFDSYTEE